MNIVINFLSCLVILIPIIITVISYVVYSNNKKYNKLLLFTVPNFILSIILPVMMAAFLRYDANYMFENGFGTFLNDLANNSLYAWILLILAIIQISLATINGVYISKEKIKLMEKQPKTKKITLKLGKVEKIILIYVIVIFLSFLITDICMLEKGKEPIFSFSQVQYLDGGTKEYYGLGYKIIDYNKLDGYTGYKIGTWFMRYDKSL